MIFINNVSFGYQQNVLTNFSMVVPKSSIFGLLGANGVGKTTLIKLILGLMPFSGTIEIFGKKIQLHRQAILQRVGALVENPALYPHLSGFQNLKLTCLLLGISYNRIDEVLEITRLFPEKDKKVKAYSHGMKQRLGIALALLQNPSLLILDEPTNGLDPYGIKEVRDLMWQLNREFGVTILLSSHLLSEIEKSVSHLGIIANGKCVYQGSLDSIKSQLISSWRLRVSDAPKAQTLLQERFLEAKSLSSELLQINAGPDLSITQLNHLLSTHGIVLFEVYSEETSLESFFVQLTQRPDSK